MLEFDLKVLYYFNQFAGKSSFFDLLILQLTNNNIFKGGIFGVIILLLWFGYPKMLVRQKIISGLIGSMLTMIAARVMAKMLPLRLRPKHNEELNFNLPTGAKISFLDGHSSFPSDHAALFFAIATMIFTVSKKGGIFAFIYVFFIICLPRIYVGLHFLSDLIAGGLIGIIMVYIMNIPAISRKVSTPILKAEHNEPGIFYAFLFLFLYQVGTLFEELRTLASFAASVL